MSLSPVATQAEQIAREAGLLARQLFDTTLSIHPKELPNDVVTNADYAVEKLLLSKLHEQFPADGFIAEESGDTGDAKAEYRWIVDPIDGTVNYAQHSPAFGVMICRSRGDELELGIIYLPMEEVMIVGERGQGVWYNRERVQPTMVQSLSTMALIVGINPYSSGREELNAAAARWKKRGLSVMPSRRSAAVNTALVVRNACQGYVTNMQSPWDIAPMHVLLPELGYTFVGVGNNAIPTWHSESGAYAAIPTAVVEEFRTQILNV